MKIRMVLSGLVATILSLYCPLSYASVKGYVIDFNQTPVAGATVTFTDESDPARAFTGTTDSDGRYEIDIVPLGINEDAPNEFTLGQNFPNPFNPSTTIPFSLDTAANVSLTVYNITGQKIAPLLDSRMGAGHYTAIWNGMDSQGNHVSTGIYFYQLRAGLYHETRKMLLLDGGRNTGSGVSSVAKSPVNAAKTAGAGMYTVAITHHSIIPYEETGIALEDGAVRDFVITLKTNISDIIFVPLPLGIFDMGDEVGDLTGLWDICRPVHKVILTNFEMSQFEITNARYAQYLNEALTTGEISATDSNVTGSNGNWSGKEYIRLDDESCSVSFNGTNFSVNQGKGNYPVVNVTWYGAKSFAEYYGFDLPTGAEWEYACRGGHQYLFGTNDGTIDSLKANYNGNLNCPSEVGSYPPNPLGLYDMTGNVWEWCSDWYGQYTNEDALNPVAYTTYSFSDIRGGCYTLEAPLVRAFIRRTLLKNAGDHDIGFRVVNRPDEDIQPDTHRINGKVLCNGTGLQGVLVTLEGIKSTFTRSDGTYYFTDVYEVPYHITFSKKDFVFSPSNIDVFITNTDVTVEDVIAKEKYQKVDITFTSISGKTFFMGDETTELDEICRPVHSTTLTDFEMSVYEITNAQYAEYLTAALASGDIITNGSKVNGIKGKWIGKIYLDLESPTCEIVYLNNSFVVNPEKYNLPVLSVTWYGAKAYATYYGYDLPTETEWEYVCRGTANYKYGTFTGYAIEAMDLANVDYMMANTLGVCFMSRNAAEWCHDWYSAYTRETTLNPSGPSAGSLRIIRGGYWNSPLDSCRSAARDFKSPNSALYYAGFRVVRRKGGVIY